jgi:hypothetical protein
MMGNYGRLVVKDGEELMEDCGRKEMGGKWKYWKD